MLGAKGQVRSRERNAGFIGEIADDGERPGLEFLEPERSLREVDPHQRRGADTDGNRYRVRAQHAIVGAKLEAARAGKPRRRQEANRTAVGSKLSRAAE